MSNTNLNFRDSACPGCAFCVHANKELMKCFPESEDCKSEYDLDESDFV